MRTIVITDPGPSGTLELVERPKPRPSPGEVLVRVRAVGVNRADLHQRRGRYPAPDGAPQDVPGLEFAGEVAEVGEGVTGWAPGERVFGITAGGAYAEYLAVHAGTLARIPDVLDWVSAAAVPEAFITAFDALVTQGGLRAGERVLITAVGSGVGVAAIQVARAMGAVPYGTTRTPDKLERARQVGLADGLVITGEPHELAAAMRGWTRGVGADIVIDLLGGPYVPAAIDALTVRGRLFLVGIIAGRSAELELGPILAKRLTIRGTILRGRPLAEKIATTRAFASHLVPLLDDGRIKPIVDAVFPLEQAGVAHELMESNGTFGKVVLEV